MLTVSIDDGSTHTKVSVFQHGAIQSFIVPVSFRKGFKSAGLMGNTPVFNYLVDDLRYTYDVTSDRSLHTTNIEYQFSDISLLSVHHALLQTGIKPQPVRLICTLPICLYYNADDCQKNERNIERKRQNLMRRIERLKGDVFDIVDVDVMPESIPAVLSTLMQSDVNEYATTLVVDTGGSTTDFATVVGKFDSISLIHGVGDLGCSIITDAAKVALANAASESSYVVANELIKRRNDSEFVEQVINDSTLKQDVLNKIDVKIKEFGLAVAEEAVKLIKHPSQIYLVGGGSSLVYGAFVKAFPAIEHKIHVMDDAQSILSKENMLYWLSSNKEAQEGVYAEA